MHSSKVIFLWRWRTYKEFFFGVGGVGVAGGVELCMLKLPNSRINYKGEYNIFCSSRNMDHTWRKPSKTYYHAEEENVNHAFKL